MTASDLFPPTRDAALARIAAVRPGDYARTRNALDGAVTRLSPYLTHGFVSLPDVLAGVVQRHPLRVQHKFVFELGWRAYFRHVWAHRGEAILQSLHPGPLPEDAYARVLPADLRAGATGVPAIDQAVRSLYATGYLHNHARMWLASYVVHLRKVHWRTGADWLLGHLLDGDLASNHLSWQWVAGTASRKPYLFNAENVARYAPPAWDSLGTVIDVSYDALDAIARSPLAVNGKALATAGVDEPPVGASPPRVLPPDPKRVAGRDVWLVHPWALGDPPADLPAGVLRLGWWPTEPLARWPWSAGRRAFVAARMQAITDDQWQGDREALARALVGARSAATLADPHVAGALPPQVLQRPPAALFPEVAHPCASFSTWWHRATRGLVQAEELAGLQAWRAATGDQRSR
ncbi:FAD-binding domain-containing protein [Thermomonas sp.]|uniref:FAD-binding domain-containing protein n=1 Tax=Thermomonas sp. TaxID=1971895 RepID=UPI0035ADE54F